jgi:hypothetical protein
MFSAAGAGNYSGVHIQVRFADGVRPRGGIFDLLVYKMEPMAGIGRLAELMGCAAAESSRGRNPIGL